MADNAQIPAWNFYPAQTGQTTSVQTILNNVAAKGLQVINSWIRDFPELMYVGLFLPNYFKDGGYLKRGGLTYAEQKALAFKQIGSIESDMTVNKNEVVWYEAGAYTERATITAAAAGSLVITVAPTETRYFAVGDVVVIKPKAGGTTATQQREVTAVDSVTGNITLDSVVTVEAGDMLMFAYNLIAHGSQIDRTAADTEVTPVRVYFQKFGGSAQFDTYEINQTRLFNDAQEYVKSKFAIVINRSNNNFARAFYLGRNIPGTTIGSKSETQGLDALIAEKEAKDGVGTAIKDATGIAAGKEKAKWLVHVLNEAATAPVYTGNEVPTVFCNYQFITSLSEVMYDMGNFFTLQDKVIEFGLSEYSSPYFKNVKFIVSHVLNNLEPNRSVAYLFPKHLVSFKVPEYQSVNENGALVKTNATGYAILKMPQTSVDFVKYTAQMTIANIFAGQSFKNTYKKIINF